MGWFSVICAAFSILFIVAEGIALAADRSLGQCCTAVLIGCWIPNVLILVIVSSVYAAEKPDSIFYKVIDSALAALGAVAIVVPAIALLKSLKKKMP